MWHAEGDKVGNSRGRGRRRSPKRGERFRRREVLQLGAREEGPWAGSWRCTSAGATGSTGRLMINCVVRVQTDDRQSRFVW